MWGQHRPVLDTCGKMFSARHIIKNILPSLRILRRRAMQKRVGRSRTHGASFLTNPRLRSDVGPYEEYKRNPRKFKAFTRLTVQEFDALHTEVEYVMYMTRAPVRENLYLHRVVVILHRSFGFTTQRKHLSSKNSGLCDSFALHVQLGSQESAQ